MPIVSASPGRLLQVCRRGGLQTGLVVVVVVARIGVSLGRLVDRGETGDDGVVGKWESMGEREDHAGQLQGSPADE
jgi:hypothetical protein